MRNPFKRKSLTGSAEVVSAIESGWSASPLIGGGSAQRILDVYNRAQGATYGWMYMNSPAVRTVIDVIVRNAGQLDLRLFEEVSPTEFQPAPDHPAAMSLRYPNEFASGDKFVREMFKDKLIYDNAYALLTPGPSNQVNLVRIPAHMVVVMGDTLFEAQNYRVWPQGAWQSGGTWGGGGVAKDFTPDQIMHWHGENPLDPRIGMSLLDTIRDVVAEDAALQQAIVELANNGLQEPTWVFRPAEAPAWSPEAAAAFEEDLTNRMRRRNTKPIVMEEGMEMRSFGVSPNDAQMLAIRQWATERVAALFGVPLGMISAGNTGQGDLLDARQEFLTDTLPPYCIDFTKMLDQRLLGRVYNDLDYCFQFNLDEKAVNADERLQTLTAASGRPVMLTNEARAKLNLPPVPEGDELVTPLNVMVGDNPLPSPGVMPVQDPNGPPQDGSYRNPDGGDIASGDDSDSAGKFLTRADVKMLLSEMGSAFIPNRATLNSASGPQEFDNTPRQLHPSRQADLERQRRHVDTFSGVVQKHYNRLSRALKGHETKHTPTTDEHWARWTKEFADDVDVALKSTVHSEGDIYTFKLAASNFKMADVQNYLGAMAEGFATALNDVIRNDVETDGLDPAMRQAPKHVASAGRSLGVRSTVWSREEAARQSGTYETRVKTWIADPGSTRHRHLDGVTIGIEDKFPGDIAPGTEPGCGCTLSVS